MNRLAFSAIGIAAVIAAGFLLTRGDAPSGAALESSEEASGAAIVEVSVPEELSERALMGQRGFEAKCIACHGENAGGIEGAGPPLVHKIYEPGHHGDAAFWLATQNGVRSHHWKFGNMPPVNGLTKSDVDNIVIYIRALQRENGIL